MYKIIKFCLPFFKKQKYKLILYVILCGIAAIFSYIIPRITGGFIDYLATGVGYNDLYRYSIIFVFIVFSGLLLNYLTNREYTILHMKLMYNISQDVILHIQNMSLIDTYGIDTAYMSQRINTDSNSIVTFILSLMQNMIIHIMTFILSSTSILFFNKNIACILFLLLILYPIAYKLFRMPLLKASYELKEKQSIYFNKLHEQLNCLRLIIIRGLQNCFISRMNPSFVSTYKASLKQQSVFYIFTGLDSIISTLAQIFVFLIGGSEVIKGNLSIGKFTIISLYFNMMLGSVRYFFSLGKSIQENKVAYNRLNELLCSHTNNNGSMILDCVNSIKLENVSFAFKDRIIFQDLCYVFNKGKIYIIIGHNGAGKTTLLNTIVGATLSKYKGVIKYNNIEIEKLNMIYIRKNRIGYMEQEPILIEDTIGYNIFGESYKNININDYDVLIKKFGLDSLLYSLPDGLNTVINEKTQNISGGEKQKISLLRILFDSPDVLILDEPTSSLDRNSKKILIDELNNIKSNKIIIITSHDPDLLSIADGKILL